MTISHSIDNIIGIKYQLLVIYDFFLNLLFAIFMGLYSLHTVSLSVNSNNKIYYNLIEWILYAIDGKLFYTYYNSYIYYLFQVALINKQNKML